MRGCLIDTPGTETPGTAAPGTAAKGLATFGRKTRGFKTRVLLGLGLLLTLSGETASARPDFGAALDDSFDASSPAANNLNRDSSSFRSVTLPSTAASFQNAVSPRNAQNEDGQRRNAANASDLEVGLSEALAPETLAPEAIAPEALDPEALAPEAQADENDLASPQTSDEDSFSDLLQHLFDDFSETGTHLNLPPEDELDLSAFELPVEMTPEVKRWLEFFSTRGRTFFTGWLARSNRYLPEIEPEFEAAGLPRELMYVAMIESGFANTSTSPMGAAGMWQFMARTARSEGLKVERWVDERRDPVKATRAAVRHFEALYNRFDDWYLVLAAYNAGAARVANALDRYNTDNFWTLARRHALRPETCNYVPRLLAAAIISENPERFGFYDVPYLDTLVAEQVTLTESTPLAVLAIAMGVDTEELTRLNPELVRNQTPPGTYQLNVPMGAARLFEARAAVALKAEGLIYRQHRVQKGETLDKIARYYGVTAKALREMNGLRSDRLGLNDQLTVPMPDSAVDLETLLASAHQTELRSEDERIEAGAARALATSEGAGTATSAQASNRLSKVHSHKVQSGETLWSIAKRYTVSVQELRSINGLNQRQVLAVGRRLDIPQR